MSRGGVSQTRTPLLIPTPESDVVAMCIKKASLYN